MIAAVKMLKHSTIVQFLAIYKPIYIKAIPSIRINPHIRTKQRIREKPQIILNPKLRNISRSSLTD